MSMNNTKSGSHTASLGLVGLWTVLATAFHFAKLGDFAEWPVIAWPWHWSCLCIAIWYSAIIILLMTVFLFFYATNNRREKKSREDAKKWMEVAKLADMGRFDEARLLAKENWPKGVPEKVMKYIEEREGVKNESNAS